MKQHGIYKSLILLLVINLIFISLSYSQAVQTIIESSDQPSVLSTEKLPDKSKATVHLSPQLRIVENNEQNKLFAKLNDWKKNFLNIQILDRKAIEDAPRVISNVSGTLLPYNDDELYISNLHRLDYKQPLAVYRLGRPITAADDKKKILGYPLSYVADVKLKKLNVQSNLSTVTLNHARGEIIVGDRVLNKKLLSNIRLVDNNNPTLDGHIVYVLETSQMATAGQSVIINVGRKEGVLKGNRFSLIENKPVNRSVQLYEKDAFDTDDESNKKLLHLPSKNVGELLVYNTYDHLSLALITANKNPVYLDQKIKIKK